MKRRCITGARCPDLPSPVRGNNGAPLILRSASFLIPFFTLKIPSGFPLFATALNFHTTRWESEASAPPSAALHSGFVHRRCTWTIEPREEGKRENNDDERRRRKRRRRRRRRKRAQREAGPNVSGIVWFPRFLPAVCDLGSARWWYTPCQQPRMVATGFVLGEDEMRARFATADGRCTSRDIHRPVSLP